MQKILDADKFLIKKELVIALITLKFLKLTQLSPCFGSRNVAQSSFISV